MLKRISWDHYFMVLAKVAALRSGCNNRKTGAVIVKDRRVLATGYNGSLPGRFQCTDNGPDYCFRRSNKISDDDKYNFCPAVHAEANAINQAAKFGFSIDGSSIYCTLEPCYVCLKSIISSGITEIYYELAYESLNLSRDKHWREEITSIIEVFEQVQLPEDFKILYKLNHFTSLRSFDSE